MVLVNGVETAHIDVHDRGLAYGDGLFETIAVIDGRVLNWARHFKRLSCDCERLGLAPQDERLLEAEVRQVAAGSTVVVKLIVTRGVGGNGYTPPTLEACNRIVVSRAWPDSYTQRREHGICVCVATHRLPDHPALAGIKHLNRLDQVIASIEAERLGCDEALMCDYEGFIIEATRCNIFALINGKWLTPRLDMCGVSGVARATIIDIAAASSITVEETRLSVAELARASELFLCNAIAGVWPLTAIEGSNRLTFPIGSHTRDLQAAFDSARGVA